MLSARSITMQYPGVKALVGVDFDLKPGEIHALCGENGAGKSTLIKILGGIIPHGRYGGKVKFENKECLFACPADALKSGIRVIHQELALCDDLTVAENICLGEEPTRLGILDKRRMESEAVAQLERLGLQIDPRVRTGSLPVGIKQLVEIARALRRNGKVLILDEPTSALSVREAENLEIALRRLRDEGYALLYISHRLDEVFRLADRITVLRNGESVGMLGRMEFDSKHVVSMMVGRKADEVFPERTKSPHPFGPSPHEGKDFHMGPKEMNEADVKPPPLMRGGGKWEGCLLSVRNWTLPSPANPDKNTLENISFDLHAGEILGLVGLMGSGRTELVESLCGLSPLQGRGEIQIEGKPYLPKNPGDALRHGLALLCEDRRGHGILPGKSVRENMTCAALRSYCRTGGWIHNGNEAAAVKNQIDSLRIKTPGMDFPIDHLSGGNQQKVLIGRWLLTRPKILILDEPTCGIDVGAKSEIYRMIQQLVRDGIGIILISSENEEVLRLSHRILVLRNGCIVEERNGGDLELEEAMAVAAGGTPMVGAVR